MALGLSKLLTSTAGALDRRFGWDKLPRPLGVLTLVGLRTRLREKNLYDTGVGGVTAAPNGGPAHARRTFDGSYTDLEQPAMGMIGARFGRNVPLDGTYPEPQPQLLEPNPRLVSRELLTRDEFKPATIVNVLAGAWLQFKVHDWFSHGKNVPEEPFELELADDDPWPERPMRIERTRSDPAPDAKGGAADLRHRRLALVGRLADLRQRARALGRRCARTRAASSASTPTASCRATSSRSSTSTGVAGNFWLGLALLHTLFTHEHNAICDRLRPEYPRWSDDELFDRARLINAALMAKIHTVEWTPAIIAHPTTKYAMRANWYGILGKRLGKRQLERGARRHPRLAHRPPRRPVLADRGVRRRLPDAPAHARRLHLPLDRDGRGAAGADVPRARRARHARPAGRGRLRQLALLVRDRPPGRDHAAQLPALPAGVQAARTGPSSTWRRPTSCASASAACRATTTSGGSST